MTEQEAITRLDAIYSNAPFGDDERLHGEEDALLVEIITQLGWTDFMAKYNAATHCRWCA